MRPDLSQIQHLDSYITDHPRDGGFIMVGGAETSIAAPPSFVFGPFPAHLTDGHFGELHAGPVACYALRDAILGRDALISHAGTALWSIALNQSEDFVHRSCLDDTADGQDVPVRRIRGQVACIHGPGYAIYGHWLTDFLPRLYVLQQAGYDIATLRFVLPHDCPGFALDMLSRIGIPAENLLPYIAGHERLGIDELIIPTLLRTGSRLHSLFRAATLAWLKHVAPPAPPAPAPAPPRRRLFVSRSAVHSHRNLVNRGCIESLATEAGFDIVHPEQLALPEQMALFAGARQIIGEYGSGLHGALYGPADLHCCALRGTSFHPGFIQTNLGAASGQTTSYVFGEAEPYATEYDYEIEPENVRRALACLDVELQGK